MASIGRLDGKVALVTGKPCRLDGKVAIVTGASSGIGQGTAVLFSKLGARLAITGRNDVNLKQTADECEKQSGVRPLMIEADLGNDEDTKRVVDETVKFYDTLHILVNSAGIAEYGSIETQTMEQYDRIMNVNTRSVFHLTKLCIPYLTKTKGSIVNVSSITGLRSFANVIAYCMSKSALDQFTKCCALELAPKQIRVNSVNPGVIITNIQKRAGMDEDAYQKFLERTKTTHPLGRPGEVPEVASTIAFLASDDSSFTTGAQIPIDGGRQCMCPR